jgi:hypothetical protein
MAGLSEFTRVYLSRGKVAHLKGNWTARQWFTAPCGASPAWYEPHGWYGTGTQEEIEKAAGLPLCKRCVKLLEVEL